MKELTIRVTGPALFDIDWGDGAAIESHNHTNTEVYLHTHVYETEGVFDVSLTGRCEAVAVSNSMVTELKNFGSLSCKHYRLNDCGNLIKVPTILPASVQSLEGTFDSCISFDDVSVSNWNTANVTNFANTFTNTPFNQPLNWDTGSGVTFSAMFRSNDSFNQSLTGFDFSSAVDLSELLSGAGAYNQPIVINASQVTTVAKLLENANSFNSTIQMSNMLSCTDWSEMFQFATAFNQPLNGLDLSTATSMDYFLNGATAYSQDLSALVTPNITEEPLGFALGTLLTAGQMPTWGQTPPEEPEPPVGVTMITDAETGVDLFSRPVDVSGQVTYASALDAYVDWCAGLALDPVTNLNVSMVNDDDDSSIFEIPFVPTISGTSPRISHSTEGGFGIYKTNKTTISAYTSPVIGASELGQQDLGRFFFNTNVPPAVIVSAKVPVADTKAIDSRHNTTADTAVFYTQYQDFDGTANNVELALLLRQGQMTIVVSGSNHDPEASVGARTYLQIFTMNELGASKQATATNGGLVMEVLPGQVVTLSSVPTNEIPTA